MTLAKIQSVRRTRRRYKPGISSDMSPCSVDSHKWYSSRGGRKKDVEVEIVEVIVLDGIRDESSCQENETQDQRTELIYAHIIATLRT